MKKTITSRLEVLLAKIAGKDASLETMTPGVPINLSEKLMLDIADRLDGIAENTPPEVTATDNGDVLTVVDGAWAKAAPSGGGDSFVVNITWGTDDYETDKTFAEAKAAHDAGKHIIINDTVNFMTCFADVDISNKLWWVRNDVGSGGGDLKTFSIKKFTWDATSLTEEGYHVTVTADI